MYTFFLICSVVRPKGIDIIFFTRKDSIFPYLTLCCYKNIRYFLISFQSLCRQAHLDATLQHYCCNSTVVNSGTLK